MSMESIRNLLRQEPFQPFMIRLSNGESYEIRHPECAALSKTKVIVTFPEEDQEVFCSLIHINSVEMLQRA